MLNGREQTNASNLFKWRELLVKILQVCHRYYPYIGGLETHVKEISERLFRSGFEIEVLTTDPSGMLPREEVINGLKIRRFKSWAPNEAYYFSESLRKYLKKCADKYDIVHAHGYHALPALYASQAKMQNKLVFTPHYHGKGHTLIRNALHIPYKFLARKIFENADKIVCVSNYEKMLILRNFRVKEEKVAIIPNGVNFEEFEKLEKRGKNHRIILCVSRLEKYKGIDFLIKVMPKLETDIHLEIVGKGPHEKNLKKLANRLRVAERVTFYKDLPREKLLMKYANADLFALLSRHEAYGISVAEALCAGTPCIVANTSALTEWIDDVNCFGIGYPINLDELAGLITRMIGKEVKRPRLYNWDEITEMLAKLYSSI